MSTLHTPPQAQLNIGVGLDVGRSRRDKPNQDSVGLYADYCRDATTLAVKGLLFVVADGMGGAAGGKEASEMAVSIVSSTYYDDPDLMIESSLEHAIQTANREIHQRGIDDPFLRGLGTTFVAVAIRNHELLVANVGDSRAYLLRQGELWQLSLDHTAVQEQVREGLLTPEEGSVHPRRHVLSRNLGSRPRAQPDFDHKTLVAGDTLLLCSDGLWGAVSDDELVAVLEQQRAAEAAQRLVDLANEHGGPDNISVIVINVDGLVASPSNTISAPVATTLPLGGATIPLQRSATPAPTARRSLRWAVLGAIALVLVLIGGVVLRGTLFGSDQSATSPAPSVVLASNPASPSASDAPLIVPATIATSSATATAKPTATPAATRTTRPTLAPTSEAVPLVVQRYSSPIESLAFAPDGSQLALGAANTLNLFEVIGTRFTLETASATPVTAAPTTSSPPASTATTTSDCGQTRKARQAVSLAFDATGEAWAAIPSGNAVEVWQLSSGEQMFDAIKHPTLVTSVVWSADGRQLASAAEDGVVIVRDRLNNTFVTIAAHDRPVCSLAFTSDGEVLATGSQDGALDLWRSSDGEHLETLEQHTGPVTALVFAPSSERGTQPHYRLASVEQNGTLKLWQVGNDTFEASRTPTRTPTTAGPLASQSGQPPTATAPLEPSRSHAPFLILDHAAPVTSVAFAPNGQLLASAGQDRMVKLWQIDDQARAPDSTATPSDRAPLAPGEPVGRLLHPTPVDSIAFAPDGQTLVSGADDGVVRLWQVGKLQRKATAAPAPIVTTLGRRTRA